MNNTKIIGSKELDQHTHQANYIVGKSVYIVKSHFEGKERLADLMYDILKNQAVKNAKKSFGV